MLTETDVEALRRDTPGVDHVVHFNNAGASLPPKPVLDATIDYLTLEAQIGGYEAIDREAASLQRVYDAGARLLHCSPNDLAFTTSAALGWWRSFEAVPLEAGDRILMSTTEYQANAFGFIQAAERGVEIEIIPTIETGEIDVDALKAMLDARVKLVSVTHVAMTNGMVQPVAEIGAVVAESNAYYLLDSCQAVGQLPVDVEELQCDFLSFTGRKFMRGPRGTGMLYVRSGILDTLNDPSYIDGRSAQWPSVDEYQLDPGVGRFELGEVSFASKVGLGVALDYATDVGLENIEERIALLSSMLRDGLVEVAGVTVNDTGVTQSGIVTFTVDGVDLSALQQALRARMINTSVLSHQISRLDLEARGIDAVIRAGVHYFNTPEEISQLIRAVGECAPDCRHG